MKRVEWTSCNQTDVARWTEVDTKVLQHNLGVDRLHYNGRLQYYLTVNGATGCDGSYCIVLQQSYANGSQPC